MSIITGSGMEPKIRREPLFVLLAVALIVSTTLASGQGRKNKSRSNQKAETILTPGGATSYEVPRALVLTESFSKAVSAYAIILQKDTLNFPLYAEYAYALALNGIYDAALVSLDKIWSLRAIIPDINYYASQVFALMGYDRLAADLALTTAGVPAPGWIASKAPDLRLKYKGRPYDDVTAITGEAVNSFRKANRLTAQGYYLKSIALFEEITAQYPDEFLPYVGYSIALERAGILNKSAQTIEKALTVVGDSPEQQETREMLTTRLTMVRSRIGAGENLANPVAAIMSMTGNDSKRLIAYAGGLFAQSFISINGRLGVVNKGLGNTSLDLGLTKSAGATSITLGFTNYSRQKVFVAGYGINAGFGGGSVALNLKISVGLSFLNNDQTGSWDVFLDGQQPIAPKGGVTTVGISIGRSVYFGTR
jgi:tetratricopeptide (TPR) repeat protein